MLGLSILMAIGSAWAQAESGEPAVYRAQLAASVNWHEVQYGDQRTAGQGVILRGEPLIVELSIFVDYEGPPTGAEQDWSSRVSLTLAPGRTFDVGAESQVAQCQSGWTHVRTEGEYRSGELILLTPSGREVYSCRLDPTMLKAGPYTLSARWNDAAVAGSALRTHRLVDSRLDFELRDVRSRADALDLEFRRATLAWLDGRSIDAVAHADTVLAAEPDSVHTLIIRGRAMETLGRCRDARNNWLKAAESLRQSKDIRNRNALKLRPEERARRAKEWSDRARHLPCN